MRKKKVNVEVRELSRDEVVRELRVLRTKNADLLESYESVEAVFESGLPLSSERAAELRAYNQMLFLHSASA
ncbi:MAG: hypothetical protein WBA28_07745 [Microbacteriaceae bacterium]